MSATRSGHDMPLTWTDRAADERPPLDQATLIREARGYTIALGGIALAIIITRLTWPYFVRTPLLLLFVASIGASRWGTETAGIVAIVAGAFGASMMVPGGAPGTIDQQSLITFVGVSFAINRIVVGRNRAEGALRSSEAQFRAAWENSAFGAALLDTRGMVERINPAMERTLGFASAAWKGVSFTHFALPEEAKDQRARFLAFMSGEGDWYEREQRYRRADGSLIWCRITMSTIRHGESAPTGVLMVVEDVTRRRKAEDALRSSEARFRALFDEVPAGLFQAAADGRILMANRSFLRMLGRESTDAIKDLRVADLVATREAQTVLDDALRAGRNVRGLLTTLMCRDALLMVTIDMRAVRIGTGTVEHYDGTIVEAPKGSVAVPAKGM
ncbi:MAG TPA: PAS domain S-box protein [Vicinamibacterales bacterium]|nr:PAS domain S-box protein [Vicinamibacterales bacterium]